MSPRSDVIGRPVLGVVIVTGPSRQYLRHSWLPDVDVYEIAEAYILVAALAGVEPGGVTVELGSDRQTIYLRGERQRYLAAMPLESDAGVARRALPHQLEIASGTFERSVTLPGLVDVRQAEVSSRYGLLEVYLPKAASPVRRLRTTSATTGAVEIRWVQ
jgi:HSP20 family molecular chaperone IbpA